MWQKSSYDVVLFVQDEALTLERELLRAPSATEDLLGAGLTVW